MSVIYRLYQFFKPYSIAIVAKLSKLRILCISPKNRAAYTAQERFEFALALDNVPLWY